VALTDATQPPPMVKTTVHSNTATRTRCRMLSSRCLYLVWFGRADVNPTPAGELRFAIQPSPAGIVRSNLLGEVSDDVAGLAAWLACDCGIG
jgi:hypothetical protein